jgi:hypothetical protein
MCAQRGGTSDYGHQLRIPVASLGLLIDVGTTDDRQTIVEA